MVCREFLTKYWDLLFTGGPAKVAILRVEGNNGVVVGWWGGVEPQEIFKWPSETKKRFWCRTNARNKKIYCSGKIERGTVELVSSFIFLFNGNKP